MSNFKMFKLHPTRKKDCERNTYAIDFTYNGRQLSLEELDRLHNLCNSILRDGRYVNGHQQAASKLMQLRMMFD